MMKIDALASKYGYDTPIFLNQVEIEGISKGNMRQIFRRLKEKGQLQQYGRGTYFIPREGKLLEKNYLDPNLVIASKYLYSVDEVYGYYTGLAFANQLGLTTQMPHRKEIVTNAESSSGRQVQIGRTKVYLYKPRNHITSYNWQVLQILDLLARIDDLGVEVNDEIIEKIREYIASNQLSRSMLGKYIGSYPGRVAILLISKGLVDAFTPGP